MKKTFLTLAVIFAFVATACVPGNSAPTPVGPGTSLPYGWYLITHASSSATCTLTVSAPDSLIGYIGIALPNSTAVLIEYPINTLRLNNDCAAQFKSSEPAVPVAVRAITYLH